MSACFCFAFFRILKENLYYASIWQQGRRAPTLTHGERGAFLTSHGFSDFAFLGTWSLKRWKEAELDQSACHRAVAAAKEGKADKKKPVEASAEKSCSSEGFLLSFDVSFFFRTCLNDLGWS